MKNRIFLLFFIKLISFSLFSQNIYRDTLIFEYQQNDTIQTGSYLLISSFLDKNENLIIAAHARMDPVSSYDLIEKSQSVLFKFNKNLKLEKHITFPKSIIESFTNDFIMTQIDSNGNNLISKFSNDLKLRWTYNILEQENELNDVCEIIDLKNHFTILICIQVLELLENDFVENLRIIKLNSKGQLLDDNVVFTSSLNSRILCSFLESNKHNHKLKLVTFKRDIDSVLTTLSFDENLHLNSIKNEKFIEYEKLMDLVDSQFNWNHSSYIDEKFIEAKNFVFKIYSTEVLNLFDPKCKLIIKRTKKTPPNNE